MTPERRRRVTGIFEAALARDDATRAAFLDEACAGDLALRAQVDAMLAAHHAAGRCGEEPGGIPPQELPRLRPSARIGPYRIERLIGAGGMGEVYRGHDERLGRDVAIKVLPSHVASDPHLKQRFEREAKALATLSHPHICPVFDVGQHEGVDYLVMEYLEGPTLAERIRQGPLPEGEALVIARQMADALEAAHDKAIVHRDLKPANVKITPAGAVKILDFGLARTVLGERGDESASTASFGDTREGAILGTVPYMSPEQARGRPVDKRTDVWAFGCVLYEMLAGRAAFAGETVSDTIAAVLDREPDWSALPASTPERVRGLLRRCLEKDARQRLHDIADARIEIDEQLASPARGQSLQRVTSVAGSAVVRRSAGALVLLLGMLGAWRLLQREQAPPRLVRPVQVSAAIGLEDYPTWSPDGRTLAYESNETGNWDIRVAQVGAGGSVNRTADHAGADRYPSWSPDGRQLAFWSEREGGGYFLMPALGGAAGKLAATPGTDAVNHGPATWSADGSELAFVSYRPAGSAFEAALEIVSVVTRETRRLGLPGTQESRLDLAWSPDGRSMAYLDVAQQPADTTQLLVLRLADGAATPVSDARANVRSPRWSPDGRALYFVSNRVGASDLWRQPMHQGAAVGQPQQLTAGLEMLHVSLSPGGDRLAYAKGRSVANVWRIPLGLNRPASWADAEQVSFDQAFIEFVDVSRDGRWLAVSSDRAGNQDIWTMALGGGSEPRRLTTDPTLEWSPRFSPDGHEIAFYSNRSGNREIWVMPAEGGPARQLTMNEALDAVPEWSPDGREIAFRSERSGSSDIFVVSADGLALRPIAPHPAGDYLACWSPDGKWLAFSSNRSGAMRIWRVAANGAGEPEPLTSGPAGYSARWSRDGRHIYFVGAGERAGNFWSVALADRTERPLTALSGRRGGLGFMPPAVSDTHLYFTWRDDLGDIWTMDVVQGRAAPVP